MTEIRAKEVWSCLAQFIENSKRCNETFLK